MGNGRARRAHETLARARKQAVRIAEGVRLKRRKTETVPGDPAEGIPEFREPYTKIKRTRSTSRTTIRLGTGNASGEAANNKIRLIIRKAYGFRNIGNMMDVIYLVCSGIRIPLSNRKPTTRKPA
ncbi:transposase [Bifidobacterium thermophilum]|uniref:transposase n=1 Tax=Bifidobacterium thermophilum TaxID=33905 RepID=UPI00309E5BE0